MDIGFFGAVSDFIAHWGWLGAIVLAGYFVWEFRRLPRVERGFTALMFGYFFLVIAAFWILKPIKKALFVAHYREHPGSLFGVALDPAQMELLAKETNIAAALLAVYALTFASRNLSPSRYAMSFTALSGLCLIGFVLAWPNHNAAFVWLFYLFADLMVTSMVAIFFSLLHDRCDPASARRIYGLVGVGGVLGGLAGSAVATGLAEAVGSRGAILTDLLVLSALLGVQYVFGRRAGIARSQGVDFVFAPRERRDWHGLAHGARIVFRSLRLKRVAAILFFYEVASVILDFQFTSAVVRYLPAEAFGAHFGAVFTFSNAVALVVQVVFTTWLMRRHGPKVALFVMPLVIMAASGLYLLFPLLLFASLLNTADSAFAYTIQQTAKETLYVPLSKQEKYEAKAFIDILWLRFSKGAAVLISLAASLLALDSSHIWLSLAVIALSVFWLDIVAKLSGLFETARNTVKTT